MICNEQLDLSTFETACLAWSQRFELLDHEPKLKTKLPNKHTHKDKRGAVVDFGWHYDERECADHLAWQERRGASYRAWLRGMSGS